MGVLTRWPDAASTRIANFTHTRVAIVFGTMEFHGVVGEVDLLLLTCARVVKFGSNAAGVRNLALEEQVLEASGHVLGS